MIEKCIYSKRYSGERIDTGIKYPALTMYRNRDVILTDEGFIELAIEFSEKSSIGLDFFERTDRLHADFFLHTEVVYEEGASLWDGLMAASHLFGLTVRDAGLQTVRLIFVRIKEEYLDKE